MLVACKGGLGLSVEGGVFGIDLSDRRFLSLCCYFFFDTQQLRHIHLLSMQSSVLHSTKPVRRVFERSSYFVLSHSIHRSNGKRIPQQPACMQESQREPSSEVCHSCCTLRSPLPAQQNLHYAVNHASNKHLLAYAPDKLLWLVSNVR